MDLARLVERPSLSSLSLMCSYIRCSLSLTRGRCCLWGMSPPPHCINAPGLLPDDCGGALPQHVLLDLARRRFRQLLDERHAVGCFEMSQPLAAQRDELRVSRGLARLQDHICVRRLSPLLMREADDRRLLHRR